MGINKDMAHSTPSAPFGLFAAASLYAPLQHLHRLARGRMDRWQLARMGRDTARVVAMATPLAASMATASRPTLSPVSNDTTRAPQNTKTTQPRRTEWGGRVVISGRMADVCAELARLAELEALASPERRH